MKKAFALFIVSAHILIFSFKGYGFVKKTSDKNYSTSSNIGFQENKGQIVDINGEQAPYVYYVAESPTLNIWITSTGLTYQFISQEKELKGEAFLQKKIKAPYSNHDSYEWHRVDMVLKNASIKKESILTENEITQSNQIFYNSHFPQGIFNVKTFQKITIKNIYNGIDWVLYIDKSSEDKFIKQDFIVRPNADIHQLKLIYEGSGSIDVLENEIKFKNDLGEMTEGALYCYQSKDKKAIASKYIATNNLIPFNLGSGNFFNKKKIQKNIFSTLVEFEIGSYNKKDTLIIDPQLVWSSYYGGNKADGPMAIESDANGNIFVCGYNGSSSFPIINPIGAYTQNSSSGGAFISKFTNSGTLLWSTHYGISTSKIDVAANSLCIDPFGNIFVTGLTSANLPLFNPSAGVYFQGTIGSTQDAFIAKFSNNGAALWATYYGGDSTDVGTGIYSDNGGNIFVTGFTESSNFPTADPGAGAYYQPIRGGKEDVFILKFTNSGIRQWATYYGGIAKDMSFSIKGKSNGDIYVAGTTESNNFPTLNTIAGSYFQNNLLGLSDGFVLNFSNVGVPLWCTYVGGAGEEQAESIAADNLGNVVVTGITSSQNFPVVNPGGNSFFQANNGGGSISYDSFIIKLNASNQFTWSTYCGGSGIDGTISFDNIEFDDCNNLYYSFATTSFDIPTQRSCDIGSYYDSTQNGILDLFIMKFSRYAERQWATFFGGDNSDFRDAIDVDKFGNLFITGEWSTPLIPTNYSTVNPGGTTYFEGTFLGGAEDGYIAKFKNINITNSIAFSNTFCYCNGIVKANPIGGCSPYLYNWYDSNWNSVGNSQTVSSLCPGTYNLIVKDTFSCITSDTTSFLILANGTNDSIIQNPTICQGNSFLLPDNTLITVAGTYYDTIPMHNGCDSMITTNLTVLPNSYSLENKTICHGQTYTWPNGSIATTSGIYRDSLTAKNGCDSIHTINLTINPSPVANIPPNINLTIGESITLNGTGFGSYQWYPSEGLSSTTSLSVIASPYVTTTYCLVVTNPNGCIDTGCVTIHVKIPCPETKELLTFPNAFSPNNDGLNDEFCVQGYYGCLETFNIFIYDRWGEKVFFSDDYNFCWNGIFEGQQLEPQVFVYFIKAKYSNKELPFEIKGNISLIK